MSRLLHATYVAEQSHFWFRGLVAFSEPLVAKALEGVASPKILDCGCGTGANMQRLSARGLTFGFDITSAGMDYAREYGEPRLAQASATAIPFASDTFDLVTAFDVLSCLDENEAQPAALAEIRRVVKPGGAVLINVAALPILRGSHAVFGEEVHRFTRAPFKRRLEAAGFVVERLTYTNCSIFPVMLVGRAIQRTMGLSSPEESGVDIVVPSWPVNAALSAVLALEARVLKAVDMPVGSSILGLLRRPR